MRRRTVTLLSVAALAATLSSLAHGQGVPPELTTAMDQAVLTVSAAGVQIYECKPNAAGALAWTFKSPRANLLINGAVVGDHFAGPTWRHKDGSSVQGRVAVKRDAADQRDIPWLRLTGESTGTGILGQIGAILRINTKGGALSGPCPAAGAIQEQAYAADYVFLKR